MSAGESRRGFSYDLYEQAEKRRRASDLIYRVFMDVDTAEIDAINSHFVVKMIEKWPKLSQRFRSITDEAIQGEDRHLKQGLFLWALVIDDELSKSFICPEDPLVPPAKFKKYIDRPDNLRKIVDDLRQSKISCLRMFVERARSLYHVL
jgi:hypothetical protein